MLRGIAIVLIMLHNFCHLVPSAIHENEFDFDIERSLSMFHELVNPSYGIINQLFSYFGHYGVSIFIFLSGYGLVRKYEKSGHAPSFRQFMWHNARKFWKILVPGTLIFIGVSLLLHNDISLKNIYMYLQLVFLANPFPGASITPYIYWYIGMAMQLYFIYFLFIRNRNNKVLLYAIAFQLILQWTIMALPIGDNYISYILRWLAANFPAWMVTFCLGIYTGRTNTPLIAKYAKMLMIPALIVYVLGLFIKPLWPLTGACFVFLVTNILLSITNGVLRTFLFWLGGISMYIYTLHPTTRALFINLSTDINSYRIVIIYTITTLVTAWIAQKVISRIS